MSESSVPPSYEELVALISVLTEQSKLIEALRVELTAMRREAGRDSSNSSRPPSQDGPASKAKAKAGKDSRGAGGRVFDRLGRDAGARRWRAEAGRPARSPGSGLARVARPDRTEEVEPDACGGCGGFLTGAEGKVACRRSKAT